MQSLAFRGKFPYSHFFWSIFSPIRSEYGEIQSICLYSVWMRENTDQNNSEYRHFLSSVGLFGILEKSCLKFRITTKDSTQSSSWVITAIFILTSETNNASQRKKKIPTWESSTIFRKNKLLIIWQSYDTTSPWKL